MGNLEIERLNEAPERDLLTAKGPMVIATPRPSMAASWARM